MMVKGSAIGISLPVVCDGQLSAPHTVPTLQKQINRKIAIFNEQLIK